MKLFSQNIIDFIEGYKFVWLIIILKAQYGNLRCVKSAV